MKRALKFLFGPVAGLPAATRTVLLALLAMRAMQCIVAAAPIRTVFVGGDGGRWLIVPDVLTFLFAISGGGLSMGFFWTPVTYVFLHGGPAHLLLNALGLCVFGTALERAAGSRMFLAAFFVSGIVGGAGWALAQGLSSMQPCVGASAAVLGLAGAFAVLRPRERFVVVFPFPCVLPAWALVAGMFVLSAAQLGASGTNVAHLAHLVGIVSGAAVGAAAGRRGRGGSGRGGAAAAVLGAAFALGAAFPAEAAEEGPAAETSAAAADVEMSAGENGGDFAEELAAIARSMAFLHERAWPGPSWRELADGAMRGMAGAVDEWSEWLDCDELEAAGDMQAGRGTGVGLRLHVDGESLLVTSPVPGSPASKAGLRIGDEIVAVDGVEVAESGPDAVAEAIDGEAGSVVTIRVRRDGEEKTFSVRRAEIGIPTVTGAAVVAPGVGYVAIEEFGDDTARDFRRALAKIGASRLDALVLDLRDNPGGVVDQAVAVASLFLPRGAVVTRTSGRVAAEDDETHRSSGFLRYPRLRLAVLVDGGTASAAEILCGALRESGRAKLVGSRTFGKGVVQDVFPAPGRDGAAFKITVARCETAGGFSHHGTGFEPDVAVRQTEADFVGSVMARMARADASLAASPEARETILAEQPDAPLAAAVAMLLSGDAAKADSPAASTSPDSGNGVLQNP